MSASSRPLENPQQPRTTGVHRAPVHAHPTARWVRCLQPRPDATLRLILLPHAGGGSGFFRMWPALLPDSIEPWAVQYPGRERRAAEPLPARLVDVVADATAELHPLLDRPTGFFGHSMGATIAYEIVHRLATEHPTAFRQVAHLFVSARQAPHHPRRGMIHTLPDDEFAEVLRRHGGTQDAVLDDPEMWELFQPILRNDYRMAETHRPTPTTPPLPVDITALTGDDDPSVHSPAAARWSDAGDGEFTHRRWPGGHFYLVPYAAEVAATVARLLRDSAERGASAAT
ncbi:thioesterase [Streptomyces triticagri]|uniref:Thioesterase n=2 Tax=Streptomyces triticagri TaxID=2293568 RepID=A0A372M0U8_9ACTN|nr:thioesterase [Streptomyces triticagri]